MDISDEIDSRLQDLDMAITRRIDKETEFIRNMQSLFENLVENMDDHIETFKKKGTIPHYAFIEFIERLDKATKRLEMAEPLRKDVDIGKLVEQTYRSRNPLSSASTSSSASPSVSSSSASPSVSSSSASNPSVSSSSASPSVSRPYTQSDIKYLRTVDYFINNPKRDWRNNKQWDTNNEEALIAGLSSHEPVRNIAMEHLNKKSKFTDEIDILEGYLTSELSLTQLRESKEYIVNSETKKLVTILLNSRAHGPEKPKRPATNAPPTPPATNAPPTPPATNASPTPPSTTTYRPYNLDDLNVLSRISTLQQGQDAYNNFIDRINSDYPLYDILQAYNEDRIKLEELLETIEVLNLFYTEIIQMDPEKKQHLLDEINTFNTPGNVVNYMIYTKLIKLFNQVYPNTGGSRNHRKTRKRLTRKPRMKIHKVSHTRRSK